MIEWLPLLHSAYRGAHIGIGMVGLLMFWVPVLARKGSRLHRVSGMAFAAIAYLAAGTGLVSRMWSLIDPWSFLGTTPENLTEASRQSIANQLPFLFSILLILSFGVLRSVTFWSRCRSHSRSTSGDEIPVVTGI